jgi:hypothetical protein
VTMVVTLKRDQDDDEDAEDAMTVEGVKHHPKSYEKVVSQRFPKEKAESWWVVVGDTNTNTLLSIKRLVVTNQSTVSRACVFALNSSVFSFLPSLRLNSSFLPLRILAIILSLSTS